MVFVANLTSTPISSVEDFDTIYKYVLTPKMSPAHLSSASAKRQSIVQLELRTSTERRRDRMRY
jgi:hypothetical protein